MGRFKAQQGAAVARLQALQRTARRFNAQLVYLFGSRADQGLAYLRGEEDAPGRESDPLADLDVGVYLGPYLPARAEDRLELYTELWRALQDIFAPFAVDLVLLDETHSVFQAGALAGHCIYAASEGARDDYEERILARAADFRPVLEAFYRERLEEV